MELSDQKRKLIECSGHILAIGGPGSGKTTVALLKAAYEIKKGIISSQQRVLFLSFARSTVARVTEQSFDLLDRNILRQVELSTYHAFTWNLIKSHGYLAFGRDPIKILTPPEATARLVGVVSNNKRTEQERLFFEERLLHFDLFAGMARFLLSKSNKLAALICKAYPLIILDEFQDTNAEEWDLVKILGTHTSLLALGDLGQRIYDFRGADPRRISDFAKHFDSTPFDFSDENHRSSSRDITAFGNDLLKGTNLGKTYHDVKIFSTTYYKTKESPLYYPLKLQVLTAIGRCRKCAGNNWSVGVLVPTKAMMAAASEYFMMNTDGLPKLYHEVSVDANGPALAASFIASLLESLEPQSSMRATVRCLISHIRGRKNDGKISKENTKIADALEGWLETGNLRGTVRQALLSECMKITSLCCNHTWTGVPGDDWRFVLEQLDSVSTQNFKDLAYDARFIKLLRKGTLLNQRLGEAWRLYGQYQGAEKAVSDALLQEHFSMSVAKPTGIQLMTLHKSKGKQFDEVVMAEGYHQDRYLNFRGNQPTDNDKERSRLLLRVGATRAVRRATILTPAGKMSCPLLLYEI